MLGFGNRESGNEIAEQESKNMEIKNGFAQHLEALRTNSYTGDDLDKMRNNMSELAGMVE